MSSSDSARPVAARRSPTCSRPSIRRLLAPGSMLAAPRARVPCPRWRRRSTRSYRQRRRHVLFAVGARGARHDSGRSYRLRTVGRRATSSVARPLHQPGSSKAPRVSGSSSQQLKSQVDSIRAEKIKQYEDKIPPRPPSSRKSTTRCSARTLEQGAARGADEADAAGCGRRLSRRRCLSSGRRCRWR